MLKAFSVENFKSIRELQTLSMEAATDSHLEASNVIVEGKLRLNKVAAIYGPNASGKSNVIEAMIWFRQFVMHSVRDALGSEKIATRPFRLSTETESAPTHFEVEFHWLGFDYRYGYQVSSSRVEAEWLFRKSPAAKEARLFTRKAQEIDVSPKFFKEGKGLEPRTRHNALFLPVCAQFNGIEAGKVIDWMTQFRSASGLSEDGYFGFTANQLQDPAEREKLLDFAKRADFQIEDLRGEVEDFTPKLSSEQLAEIARITGEEKAMTAEIKTIRRKLDAQNSTAALVEFNLREDESQGTQKFIALSGPLKHTLEQGSILIVDELEARLHPRLTQAIVDLFHGPANPKGAQLICATHEVHLLEPERFRRDQIWFCEKDESGATDLYSLADIESDKIRATSKFSRQYMLGIFGAVPHLAHFQEAALHGTL